MTDHLIDIADQIYDKLMDNTMHRQFSADKVENPCIDDETGTISFKYEGVEIVFRVKYRDN